MDNQYLQRGHFPILLVSSVIVEEGDDGIDSMIKHPLHTLIVDVSSRPSNPQHGNVLNESRGSVSKHIEHSLVSVFSSLPI